MALGNFDLSSFIAIWILLWKWSLRVW